MTGPIATAQIETAIGCLLLSADDDHLLSVRFKRSSAKTGPVTPILAETVTQLDRWFAGKLQYFDLPLFPLPTEEGRILRAGIASVPYGETLTYGAVAALTGSVARAVGQACKTNTFPLIIPCHRVISSAGPEYYSGGDGPRTKSWLIDFEYANLAPEKRTRLI
jgi:methylated-DNA-[protein]-cysteine S-methyltransferase